jgi:hypothetical protein
MTVAEIQTLIAGIESGFLQEQIWRQLSERALLEVSPVPVWLAELYDAKNTEDALGALYRGWNKTYDNNTSPNQTELYLGFLYLHYLAGNLALPKLLLEAGEFADKANFSNPSCEAFYQLLNEYEGRDNSQPENSPIFNERVENLFSDYASLAKKQLVAVRRLG